MTDSKNPKLRVSKAEATEKIGSRIDIGKELLGRQLSTLQGFEELKRDTKKWTDYNKMLFENLFDESPLPWWHGVTTTYAYDRGLDIEIPDHTEKISVWINELESVYEQLDLLPSNTQQPTNQDTMNLGVYKELPSNTQQPTNQDTVNNEDKKIFIGHGRSHIWRELKDFLEDTLNLSCEEFNRIPTAGKSTVDRLKEMLDESYLAFLIMTGEDEQADGSLRARSNVIHEVGLFQGKLGFERAIILLEEDCQDFSNIHGITYIRFPKGRINATFGEIVRVLKQESTI